MTVYRLHEVAPTLPDPGAFWIASEAVVAGRVRVGRNVGM